MELSTAGDLLNAAVYRRTRSSQGLRSTWISARAPTDVLRSLVRKVRRSAFGGLNLHLLARFHFDQGFGGCAILSVGLAPDFAAKHGNVVVEHRRSAGAGPTGRAVADLVSVIELLRSHARLNFEPAGAIVAARKQRAV